MTRHADLLGNHILVLEDDYFLAQDAARAVLGAGAEVLGPFPTEEDASAALEGQTPSAAIVDINLGMGASFKIAKTLQTMAVPFVFMAG